MVAATGHPATADIEGPGSPDGSWRLGHRPALDGVRGVAIAFVVLAHATFPIVPGGGVVGVHLFFVLSGFLITALLLEEWRATETISLRAFYWRRAVRLLPALIAFLGIFALIALLLGLNDRIQGILIGLTYVSNWARVAGIPLQEVGHTWSLAVEEQFYLLWPVVVIIALKLGRGWLTTVVVAGTAYAFIARPALYLAGEAWPRIYYGTDLVASSLLLGALGAMACSWGWLPDRSRAWRAAGWAAFIALVAATMLVNQHGSPGKTFLALVGWSGVGIAGALLIVSVARYEALRFLAQPWLVWLGKVSYALYLWHFLVLWHLGSYGILIEVVIGIPVSLVLAQASMILVERPAMRWKQRFGGRTARRVPADVAGGLEGGTSAR
jgi:peptidoglycan/LPS O-acetylase OafA/YrhL